MEEAAVTYTPHVITQKRVDVEMSSQGHIGDEGYCYNMQLSL